MSRKYKKRITSFLGDITKDPIQVSDYYQPEGDENGNNSRNHISQSLKRSMIFSAPRTDNDIRHDNTKRTEYLDTDPPLLSEVQAWNMRPRDKNSEIGPEFRFDSRT